MSCGKVQNPTGFAPCRVAKSKTCRVLRYVMWQSPKPAKFFMYPCRGVLHTPRNVLRRRFGSKIGRVFGASVCGNMKPGGFLVYPCRGVLHTPQNVLRQEFAPKTRQVLGVSLLGRVKSGAFLVGTRFGRHGGSGVLTPINGDRQNASQIRPIFAASN